MSLDIIHIIKVQRRDWNGKLVDGQDEYLMIPINEYQMGNLIDAIGQVADNGDWWGEFCNMVVAAMKLKGLTELRSNRGNSFTLEDVDRRTIRRPAPASAKREGSDG